jgi:hypothetical protein
MGEEANNSVKQHCQDSAVYQQITSQDHCKLHLQKDKVTILSRNLYNDNNSTGTFHQPDILKMHKSCISFKLYLQDKFLDAVHRPLLVT